MKNAAEVMVLYISQLRILPEKSVKKVVKFLLKNLEVNQKVVPLHSHLKNGWLMRLRVLGKTGAEMMTEKKF